MPYQRLSHRIPQEEETDVIMSSHYYSESPLFRLRNLWRRAAPYLPSLPSRAKM